MGLHKRTHIEQLCATESIAEAWQAKYGLSPQACDVSSLFSEFIELQHATLRDHATPVAGCVGTIAALRGCGIRIGSTTGYTRALMDVLAPEAERLGYAPDVIVTSDEVERARPWPDMALHNMMQLGVSAVQACVKVDDTAVGIEEGLRAGMHTVGIVMTGNEMGCTAQDLEAMPADEGASLRLKGIARLRAAGAHYVVDSITDLPLMVDLIEGR